MCVWSNNSVEQFGDSQSENQLAAWLFINSSTVGCCHFHLQVPELEGTARGNVILIQEKKKQATILPIWEQHNMDMRACLNVHPISSVLAALCVMTVPVSRIGSEIAQIRKGFDTMILWHPQDTHNIQHTYTCTPLHTQIRIQASKTKWHNWLESQSWKCQLVVFNSGNILIKLWIIIRKTDYERESWY